MIKRKLLTISFLLLVFGGCFERKTTPSGNITQGLDFMVREDYDKAIKVFSDILTENQKNTSALYYRGVAYLKKSDDVNYLTDFKKLYEIDKDFNFESRYFWDVITNCFSVRKDYPKSIEMSVFYIKKFPGDGNILLSNNIIANSYLRLKEFDKAIDYYQKVIDISVNGKSAQERKVNAEAKNAIDFIKQNSDYDRKPLYMFSDVQNEIDPLKKIEIARKILELYPKCNLADKVQYQIARLYSVDGLNDFDQAIKEYQILIDKYPKSPLAKSAEYSILGISEKYDPEAGKLHGTVH
ncbi:MAG: tetratricopeptide repeat protein [bacterium]